MRQNKTFTYCFIFTFSHTKHVTQSSANKITHTETYSQHENSKSLFSLILDMFICSFLILSQRSFFNICCYFPNTQSHILAHKFIMHIHQHIDSKMQKHPNKQTHTHTRIQLYKHTHSNTSTHMRSNTHALALHTRTYSRISLTNSSNRSCSRVSIPVRNKTIFSKRRVYSTKRVHAR